jgi:hypothetical protein
MYMFFNNNFLKVHFVVYVFKSKYNSVPSHTHKHHIDQLTIFLFDIFRFFMCYF